LKPALGPVVADPVVADPVVADTVVADTVVADRVVADPVAVCPAAWPVSTTAKQAVPRVKRRSRRERIDASGQPRRKGLPYLSTIPLPG
jgi:hypothetical protein